MTLKEAQELIEAWNEKNSVKNSELTTIALLTEELGRLARVIAQTHGEHGPSKNEAISREIGNTMWALIGVANQTNTDLTISLINALEDKSTQKR